MNKALILYCRYYKGEKSCPLGKSDIFANYWHLERNYLDIQQSERDYWESDGLKMCIESFPETKDFILSFEDKEVRGMLASFVILSVYNNPQGGLDFIFDYGKQ